MKLCSERYDIRLRSFIPRLTNEGEDVIFFLYNTSNRLFVHTQNFGCDERAQSVRSYFI